MNKVLNLDQVETTAHNLRKQNKKIVLVGGCFDILHAGHIFFLEKSKQQADILIVFLESDENIKLRKGKNRPINSQKNRSIVLSSIEPVNYIIPLVGMTKGEDYDKLIVQIKPDVIALTTGDKYLEKRKEQASVVGAKLIEIEKIEGISSSKFAKNILWED